MALVCSCARVSERRLAKAIAHGAANLNEVADACGAGARCGGCRPIISEQLAEQATPVMLPGGFAPA